VTAYAGRARVGGSPGDAPAGLSVPLVELAIDRGLERSTLPSVRRQLDEILALRPKHLVLDLAACPVLDAAGIGLLLDVHRRLWRMDGVLSLRSPTPRLRRVLHAARVAHVLHITPEEEPADRPPASDLPT
jgi:anti-anti-sigma factor